MNFKLSQQVSATYARNNFKAVNEKVLKEGMCVIINKSKPSTILMSMDEYKKITKEIPHETKAVKKITLEELRRDTSFDEYAGCLEDHPEFKGKTSRQILKEVWKNVD